MGLSSIFKRRTEASPHNPVAEEPANDVQRARTRARQRLIGAAVLVAIGVIGFPLVFETQPRPIPVDIPIEIPRKDGGPPLVMPTPRLPGATAADRDAGVSAALPPALAAPLPTPRDEVITEPHEESGRGPASVAMPLASAVAAAPPPQASRPAVAKPAVLEAKPAPNSSDGARAKALLEAKAPPAVGGARFVVQVGAFADPGAARETRAKAEALGLKTYTQVAETTAGPRTRVRLGPFATRDEADKALAKARSAGLTAVVLTL